MSQENNCSVRSVYAQMCPCRDLLDVIASRWGALTIGALEGGPMRFGELQRQLEGISPKVLTATLRKLEDFGLITRTAYPEVPVRVEYALTEKGGGAAVPLRDLRLWIEANA